MHALKVKRLEIPKYQKSLAADKQKGSKHVYGDHLPEGGEQP